MPWIDVVSHEQAEGSLKQQYDNAVSRAGKIYNIVSIMSQNPATMKVSMEMYGAIMMAPSELSRAQREMLAVVVSAENHCVY